MQKRLSIKKLGELLVERNIITPNQLAEALSIQEIKGGLLGELLVELGFCKEEQIAQSLTMQYGFPYLPLAGYEIDYEVIKTIPENVAHQYVLIPVDKVDKTLSVAMSNPLNTQAIEDLEMITQSNITIFVSTATDIRNAISRFYRKENANPPVKES